MHGDKQNQQHKRYDMLGRTCRLARNSAAQAKYEALLAHVENTPRAESGPSSDFPAGSVFAGAAADVAAHVAADVGTDVGGGAGADALLYRSRFPRLELRKSIN